MKSYILSPCLKYELTMNMHFIHHYVRFVTACFVVFRSFSLFHLPFHFSKHTHSHVEACKHHNLVIQFVLCKDTFPVLYYAYLLCVTDTLTKGSEFSHLKGYWELYKTSLHPLCQTVSLILFNCGFLSQVNQNFNCEKEKLLHHFFFFFYMDFFIFLILSSSFLTSASLMSVSKCNYYRGLSYNWEKRKIVCIL